MRRLNKLLVTRLRGRLIAALTDEKRVVQMNFADSGDSILNNIYVGKVKNLVKNLNAAFVEFGSGQIGYLALGTNPDPVFTTPHLKKGVREGDELLVQISKEPVKTKAPVLSSSLSFSGRYLVLTTGRPEIGFSGKIKDGNWKNRIREALTGVKEGRDYGLIVRTNARDASQEEILAELELLEARLNKVLELGRTRTCFSLLYEAPKPYLAEMRDAYTRQLQQIVTDLPDCYQEMKEFLMEYQPDELDKLVFYEDSYPLEKLFSLESALEQALSKRVWLKSGGYLIIEPTEALTVIDVNSGKYTGKKTVQETILKINLEAAEEIARQIRLRNLSGIIIVDFIDLERAEDKEKLLEAFGAWVEQDPIRTNLVDMTKLNLVELTRKKVRRPLHEQIQEKFIQEK